MLKPHSSNQGEASQLKNMKKKVLIFLLLGIILISGCNQVSTPEQKIHITIIPTSQTSDNNEVSTMYPNENCGIEPTENPYPIGSVIPTPVEENEIPYFSTTPFATPVKAEDTGAVFGILKSNTDASILLSGIQVYIANMTLVEPDGGYVYTIQQKTSPQTTTHNEGEFAISGINPGEYVLLLVTPIGTALVEDGHGDPIILNVNAGDVIELGEVFVDWP